MIAFIKEHGLSAVMTGLVLATIAFMVSNVYDWNRTAGLCAIGFAMLLVRWHARWEVWMDIRRHVQTNHPAEWARYQDQKLRKNLCGDIGPIVMRPDGTLDPLYSCVLPSGHREQKDDPHQDRFGNQWDV